MVVSESLNSCGENGGLEGWRFERPETWPEHAGRALQAEGSTYDSSEGGMGQELLPSPGMSVNGSPPLWSSLIGLFLRHMILAYSKLSFSQVFKLYTALQQYFQNGEKKTVEDADMDREDGERQMEKEELDVSVR